MIVFCFVVEAYITEGNLKTDYTLANCARENNGWIRLELLNRCTKLSCYNYDTILRALCSKQSNLIELSSFEPRCIRRRCQPLTEHSIQDTENVVVITGLPLDVRYEELIEFFHRFYPIREITKIYSYSNRFQGKIHVIFNESQDALAFVQRSKLSSIIYANDQSFNGYPLVCQMLNDEQKFFQGKSFSTRLNNQSKSLPSSNHHSGE
jgi:RNA recognition motif-containing protein